MRVLLVLGLGLLVAGCSAAGSGDTLYRLSWFHPDGMVWSEALLDRAEHFDTKSNCDAAAKAKIPGRISTAKYLLRSHQKALKSYAAKIQKAPNSKYKPPMPRLKRKDTIPIQYKCLRVSL
jgi:hypothetical protein